MSHGETRASEAALTAAHTINSLMGELSLTYAQANSLVDCASQGLDTVLPRIEGMIEPGNTNGERARLDAHFGNVWAVIDEIGHRLTGTGTTNLRNPEGQITNPGFIKHLIGAGVAIELTRRDATGVPEGIAVNKAWLLPKGRDGKYLPWARVRSVDVDGSKVSRIERGEFGARAVYVAEEVVVFRGLRLPSLPN